MTLFLGGRERNPRSTVEELGLKGVSSTVRVLSDRRPSACCICGEQEEGLFLIHKMMPFGLAGHCSTQRLSEHGDCFLAWTSSVTVFFWSLCPIS